MPGITRRLLTYAAAAASLFKSARAQDLSWVHADLRAAAKNLMTQPSPFPPVTTANLPARRQAMAAYAPAPQLHPTIMRKTIPGDHGAPHVQIYMINAEPGAHRPAILHMHGGGYIMGDPAADLPVLQQTALALDCVIISVSYRLAPETSYAGSTEDNYAALSWLHKNAADVGADPARIAVMGESAGGGHAALLAILARDRGEISLVFQALIYPMLDDRTGVQTHPKPPVGQLLWTENSNRLGWEAFLGQPPGTPRVPASAVPARAVSLAGLPPAFIGVGAIDLFVDEDITYANRLIDAGVPTELLVVPGAFHGFDVIAPATRVAQDFTAAKLAALRGAFGT